MSSAIPRFENARLNQIVWEEIPWRFRAASTLGTYPFNLSREIELLIKSGALVSETGHPAKIIRRCETDAIEFGAYASIRWLLELLEIKFFFKGKQPNYKEADPNIWLRDICPDLKTSPLVIEELTREFGIKFKDEYEILSSHGIHPSKNFTVPRITPGRIDDLLAFIESFLIRHIYKSSQNFRQLWFRDRDGDPASDKPRVSFKS